jgi:halimadienyl-diphosphate synthase
MYTSAPGFYGTFLLYPLWIKRLLKCSNPILAIWHKHDTIITFDLLRHYGYDVDVESILSFEEETHFRCYNLEVGISPSVNIHALKALRTYGYTDNHPTIQKILTYLRSIQKSDQIWVDKWHSSPYYSTAHFIIACAGFDNELAQNAVQWILSTQQSNGCWGYYMPTQEETAYCVQALSIWQLKTGAKTTTAVKRGAKWLQDNDLSSFPPLWIGKGLYSADLVVRATIISALMLAQSIE